MWRGRCGSGSGGLGGERGGVELLGRGQLGGWIGDDGKEGEEVRGGREGGGRRRKEGAERTSICEGGVDCRG